MNWLLIFLIGFVFGGAVGLISGMFIADDWWRKKSHYYDRLYSKDKNNVPYEIEKGETIKND